jgi:NADPH2:quinone reductase
VNDTNKGFAVKIIADDEAPFSKRLAIIDKPIPQPKPGQVLVKVLASPVNPSDLVFLQGYYGIEPVPDMYAGFEGCGLVVAANAGLYGKWLVGKRVAMGSQQGYDGFWSKYAVTRATNCLPLRKGISDEQGATLIVNPLTSVCLVERARALGAKSVVVNAAASQVGKGVIRYAKLVNIKVIATVRSQSNVEVLKALGADCVLLSTAEDFTVSLKAAAQELKATVLFDAVGADDTARALHNMPNNSTAIVYGRLTETKAEFGGEYPVSDLIFRNCKLEGFWLAYYMQHAKPWQILALSRKVQKLFAQGIFNTDIYGTFGFDDFSDALTHYAVNKSDGKVIFKP